MSSSPRSIRQMIRLLPLLMSIATVVAETEDHPEGVVRGKFLQNGEVKIGVDLSSGGSIFWFSEVGRDRNLLNHMDRGRFVQQSYYGNPDGSVWADKPWCWNPVQGGDYKGKPAKVEEVREAAGSIYLKSIPVNWAGGQDLEECRMEEWITLEGGVAHLRFRFTYQGKESHAARHQELPAVFVDAALADLVYYKGDAPWKNQPVTKERPGWPNQYRRVDEDWAGFIGADGRGLGVFFPGTKDLTTYRHPGPEGPRGPGCSYFAPIRTLAITPAFVLENDVYLTIGTPDEMRARFQPLAEKHLREAAAK